MAPPAVSIYVTSLTSQPKVRQNTDLLRRSLRALEIPFTEHDLVNEPDAKTRWQRAKPPGMVVGLPGFLVGGEWAGTMEDFEEAVEGAYLPTFLKQDMDLSAPSGADAGSGVVGAGDRSIGEAELERLMREMTSEDLDALAAEVGVDKKVAGGGLMVPEGAIPVEHLEEEVKVLKIGEGNVSTDIPPAVEESKDSKEAKEISKDKDGETTQLDKEEPTSPSSGSPGVVESVRKSIDSTRDTIRDLGNKVAESANIKDLDEVVKGVVAPSPVASQAPKVGNVDTKHARRMSKEDIAAEINSASTVDGLMDAVSKAEGKEKVD